MGKNAFAECRDLKNIRIYNYELNEHRYLDLKASSLCANKTVYISQIFPEDKILKSAVDAASVGAANFIQDDILRLFTFDTLEYSGRHVPLHKISCYGFGGKESFVYENESVRELIQEKKFEIADALSEGKNDQFLKDENIPYIKKTAIFSFDDSKTKYENGKYFILANLVIGYHFWQSVVPITIDGRFCLEIS